MSRLRRTMRIKNSLLWVLVLAVLTLLIFSNSTAAEEIKKQRFTPTAKAEVNKDSITIGDKIKYSIKVQAKQDIDVEFPSFGENLAGFAIKDFGSKELGLFGKKTYLMWYLLDIYKTGEYTIPKAIIRYKEKNQNHWQEIETNEVKIEVQSVLKKADDTSDIRDIKNPISFPHRLNPYLIAGSFIFVAFVMVLLGKFLMKKKEIPKTFPSKPAHEIAYEALKELKEKDYIRLGRIKEYYIELSNIVRRYLENRFNIKAPEMTTEEFLIKAKEAKELSFEHKSLLRDFLSHCDLVKFARYGPSAKEIDSSFESAKTLIDQTKLGVNKQLQDDSKNLK